MAAPSSSEAAARAESTRSSVTFEVTNAPPRFAFAAWRYAEIAWITESGTCVPPGPSKNASGERSAVKRSRTFSIVGGR